VEVGPVSTGSDPQNGTPGLTGVGAFRRRRVDGAEARQGKEATQRAPTQIAALPTDKPSHYPRVRQLHRRRVRRLAPTIRCFSPCQSRGVRPCSGTWRLHRIHHGKTVVRVYEYVDGLTRCWRECTHGGSGAIEPSAMKLEARDPNQRHLLYDTRRLRRTADVLTWSTYRNGLNGARREESNMLKIRPTNCSQFCSCGRPLLSTRYNKPQHGFP